MLNSGRQHRSYIVRTKWLLPVSFRPLENAWLRVERGLVTGFGTWPPRSLNGLKVIDQGNSIITTGFVNAHTHLEFSSCQKPFNTAGGLHSWLREVVSWKREHSTSLVDPTQNNAAIISGIRESAASGVVALGEIATTNAPYNEIPNRPRLRVFQEFLGLGSHSSQDGLSREATCIRDAQRLSRAGVAVGLSPHAPYSTQWNVGQTVANDSRKKLGRPMRRGKHGIRSPLAMHLAESEFEAEFLKTQTGHFRTLFEDLGVWPNQTPHLATTADWISLLATSDRGLIIHGTHLYDDQVAFSRLKLHRQKLTVVVCPRTTLALSGKLPPISEFKKSGVRVCLGTDGRGSNPDLSIRAEAACLIESGLVTPQEALSMISANGAWALGFEHRTGCIAAGRPADFVILRPSVSPNTAEEATMMIFDCVTEVVATFRGGRPIAGNFL